MTDSERPAARLGLDAGVELGAAWLSALAASLGARALIIKGATLARQGLRTARSSADVDLLVEPARYDDVLSAVEAAGWREFPSGYVLDRISTHSRAYARDGWPHSIDVHRVFPGFFAAPEVVFDALWEHRVELDFAHRRCPVPDRAGSALILALHSLRARADEHRPAIELAGLLELEFSATERAELAELAERTGAVIALREVLPRLGVDVDVRPEDLDSPARRAWEDRLRWARSPAAAWFRLLRVAPWRQKPVVVLRAIWSSKGDIAAAHPELTTRGQRFRFRLGRLARGSTMLGALLAVRSRGRRRD